MILAIYVGRLYFQILYAIYSCFIQMVDAPTGLLMSPLFIIKQHFLKSNKIKPIRSHRLTNQLTFILELFFEKVEKSKNFQEVSKLAHSCKYLEFSKDIQSSLELDGKSQEWSWHMSIGQTSSLSKKNFHLYCPYQCHKNKTI